MKKSLIDICADIINESYNTERQDSDIEEYGLGPPGARKTTGNYLWDLKHLDLTDGLLLTPETILDILRYKDNQPVNRFEINKLPKTKDMWSKFIVRAIKHALKNKTYMEKLD